MTRSIDALVTGAAGFIGSHLCERLLDGGASVAGVDCLTPYYDIAQKQENLSLLDGRPGFRFEAVDLRTADLRSLLDGVGVVYHLAGQPGVRSSWEEGFTAYTEHNLLATQRMLEAASTLDLSRFVFASSSSVYGDADEYPCTEDTLPRPHSPYGVTKLAAEHLCRLYAANRGVPTVNLRYFSVYGPRQRPDMAFHKLISCALSGQPFPLYGSGDQMRDFTYVSDVVDATIAAGGGKVEPGTVMNVAGGSTVALNEAIDLLTETLGMPVQVERFAPQAGDVRVTAGSTSRASSILGWSPQTDLATGLSRQVDWHRHRAAAGGR